jgi:threonine dehydrogenase-like Zn-dependent dehydrogenase
MSEQVRRAMARDGGVVLVDEMLPDLGPGDVLVRSAYSVISPGTERSIIRATEISPAGAHEYPHHDFVWPRLRSSAVDGQPRRPRMPPDHAASLGYSVAGVVERVGPAVTDLVPGDRVACSGSQCAYHADRVVVPRNLTSPVPQDVSLRDAAHVTLGTIAIEALRRTSCTFGETVVLLGAGMLGLLLTQLSAAAGVYPVAVDTNTDRLDLARRFGAVLGIPAADDDGVRGIRSVTDGFGADAVIVAAADPESVLINFAFDALRPGGRVVALGDFGMTIDRAKFFRAQATFVPSIAYGPGRYDPVYEENNVDLPINAVRWTENRNQAHFLRMLSEKRIDLEPFETVEVPFERAPEAYHRLLGANSPLTGVMRYPVGETL